MKTFLVLGSIGMSLTTLLPFILHANSDWINNKLLTTVIIVSLGVSYFCYGASLCSIAFIYPVLTLPERGVSLVVCQYWISMAIMNIGLRGIMEQTSAGTRIHTWYLDISSLLMALVIGISVRIDGSVCTIEDGGDKRTE
eukprot:TRINITY_DN3389_c0_g1_i11.p2 TRINITY_DN3389_c0_g1~~TRINITY_DN3389_c0_g1_i11.p2  ORF type:complete len:140 (+),score=14.85 TRINITY_DN3389_c0_g1_i11:810-1229(+)